MKPWLCGLLFSISLVGCYSGTRFVPFTTDKKPTSRVFQTSMDSTWTAIVKVMAVFPLTIIEKNSGILNTDWMTRTIYRPAQFIRNNVTARSESAPVELTERFNVILSPATDSTVLVRMIRYCKARPYVRDETGTSWAPKGEFNQIESNTIAEWKLLNAIEECLLTGNSEIGSLDDTEFIHPELTVPSPRPKKAPGASSISDHR